METKEAFRSKCREMRKRQTASQLGVISRDICSRLISMLSGEFNGREKIVAVYLAKDNEISLDAFIEYALANGMTLAAPRWNGECYDLAALTSLAEPHVAIGPMQIREPGAGSSMIASSEVDVWLVPGLCFTLSGKRIGYGGGWYDRLLAGASADSVKIGIAASYQIFDDLPVEETDIAMDCCITEKVQTL